ncbi:MAG: ABC transporter substrate-binding protein [Nocardioidaceae bacterium]|nr:ABC transporter substrate-binding protein [Nocardioidaceae bacterium]
MNTSEARRTPASWRRATAATLILAVCGGALTACGGSAGSAGGGTTLRMAIPADEGCIDPAQLLGRSQLTLARAMVDSLVFQDGEKYQPWLASAWTVSPDAKTFTFELRDDVTFSDGSPLTAQTVADNLLTVQQMGAKARLGSSYLATMTAAKATGEHQVTVTFSEPNASFLQAVSTPSLGIVSSKTVHQDPAKRCLGEFSGSGSFVLDKYRSNEQIDLVKRKGYDWAPSMPHRGDARYDAVTVSIVPESGVRAGTLVSGQNDYITEIQRSDLKTLDRDGIAIESRSNPGIAQQLWVNPKGPVLSDVAVRKALEIGVDREQLIDSTLTKYQKVATSVLSSTTPGYVDLAGEMTHDAAKAKSILEDAGWRPGADGIRSKDGRRLRVSLLYGSQLYGFLVPLMELLQQQLKELGIELTLRPLPDADANTAWIEGDYELRISALTRSDADALRTGMAGLDGALDKLLEEQARTVDPAKRKEIVAQAQKMILEQGYSVPINELALPMAHSEDVTNVVYTTDSLVLLAELEPR